MMPSERRGTVTNDIKGFMRRLQGSIEFRGDKAGTVRTAIGKVENQILIIAGISTDTGDSCIFLLEM
jgi:ribosomal protein L1